MNWRRVGVWSGLILLGLIIVINLAVPVIYAGRIYPGISAGGVNLGGKSKTEASGLLSQAATKYQLTVKVEKQTYTATSTDLGANFDPAGAADRAYRLGRHGWLPFLDWLNGRRVIFADHVDSTKLQQFVAALSAKAKRAPVDASVVITSGQVSVKPEQAGITLDQAAATQAIADALTHGSPQIELKPKLAEPTLHAKSLSSVTSQTKKILGTHIELTYQTKRFVADSNVIAGWITFTKSGDTLKPTPSQPAIADFVHKVAASINAAPVIKVITQKDGVTLSETGGVNGLAVNEPAAVSAIVAALSATKDLQFTLTSSPVAFKTSYVKRTSGKVNYTYCVQLKNVDGSNLNAFAANAAQVYASPSGWSMNGQITFTRVTSGCSFILWLAAPNDVAAFSSACSSFYSCTVANNVIINFDRWSGGSPNRPGSLDDYRQEVINHETGHWLGLGHQFCSGAGQLAPVMQQQSISMQGCAINSLPLQFEKLLVANPRGLTP